MKIRNRLLFAVFACLVIFFIVIAYWTVLPRHGTVEIPGQGIYTGQLKGSTFHGYGSYVSYAADGVSYEGEWKAGVFHGKGTMIFSNGATLSGEFKDGEPHGTMIMTSPDGNVQTVEYEHGEPINNTRLD